MRVELDVAIERMEKRMQEFLENKHGVERMEGGKQLVAAAKSLLTACSKVRQLDKTEAPFATLDRLIAHAQAKELPR